jgi:hypothetical protein
MISRGPFLVAVGLTVIVYAVGDWPWWLEKVQNRILYRPQLALLGQGGFRVLSFLLGVPPGPPRPPL